MKLYPVMINLEESLVVMIGAGEVALRKTADLLEAGAVVKIISPVIHIGFAEFAREFGDRIEIVNREYTEGDLERATLAFSATNDPGINRNVFREAMEKNILINSVDDPHNCSFFIPSIYKKGDLLMTLSTSGASPAMAARLRRELEKYIPDNIDLVLRTLRMAREMLKDDKIFSYLDFEKRGRILKIIVNDDELLDDHINSYKEGSLREMLQVSSKEIIS